MPMNIGLYLDTNIYLSFYHLSNDDIEELKKLLKLVKGEEITLYLPSQTIDEFHRNRDSKITDGLNRFEDNQLSKIFPQIVKDYIDEYKLMRKAIKVFEKNKHIILDKLKLDIVNHSLNADKIITDLFEVAEKIEKDEELIRSARNRLDFGNPPGKKGSYGDALNWECLLAKITDIENFYFISDDKDYYSKFDKSLFNTFLINEWKEKFPSINFNSYRSLSSFLRDNYPDITLDLENEKEELILWLQESGSFARSRSILHDLIKYNDFTRKQLNDIFHAAVTNNQIYWIRDDHDINDILLKLLKGNESEIEPDLLESFRLMYIADLTEDDELPF